MRLTEAQKRILTYLAASKGEGWEMTRWIAECCGQWYNTPWASSRMPSLLRNGLVEKAPGGYWRITEAGRRALSQAEGGAE